MPACHAVTRDYSTSFNGKDKKLQAQYSSMLFMLNLDILVVNIVAYITYACV